MSNRFDLTPDSQARFFAALERINLLTKKSAPVLLAALSNMFAQSARADTPISRKKREVFTARSKAQYAKQHGWKYAIRAWNRDDGREKMLYTDDDAKRDHLSTITWRGAARGAWSRIISQLPGGKNAGDAIPFRRFVGSATQFGNPEAGKIAMQILYAIKYLAKLRPNIQNDALIKAQNRFVASHARKYQDELKQYWGAA